MNLRCRYTSVLGHLRECLTESGAEGTQLVGRLYPVNGNGERCAKPKKFEKSDGSYSDQRRPIEVSPHVWWKMMTKAERLQWWIDNPEVPQW